MTHSSIKSVLVYDVGGSHVSAAVCREDDFQLSAIASAHYPAEATSAALIDLFFALGTSAMQHTEGVTGAEMAFPGPFDYANGISHMKHKLPCLLGVDLRHSLAERFGFKTERVRFLNDAAAYLLGEVGAGAGKGVRRCAGVTLGTGIGSGFAVDGHIVTTGKGVPPNGEIWNLPYEGGILEDAISTRALQAHYRDLSGEQLEVAQIAARAASDPHAAEVFARFGHHLGTAFHTFMAEFEPDAIVLGGGIAHSAPLFLPQAQAALGSMKTELRIATLFDKAPLVGAAVAWFEQEKTR